MRYMRGTVCVSLFWILFSYGQAFAKPLEVFVSIAPQKYLVDSIAGESVRSNVLIGEGKSPHFFHPSTRQLVALSQAKLFFAIDMPFEQAVLAKLPNSATSLKVINSVSSIQKQPFFVPPGDDAHAHEGHTTHTQHGHSQLDPHVWLSPVNLKAMAAVIAESLVEADPDNAALYKKNMANLQGDLDALDKVLADELAPYAGGTFYVFHPSFGYFASRYQLQQKAVEVEGKSPSPKQLKQLIASAKRDGVKVIFAQSQFDSRSAKSVAKAIGGEVMLLDPLAENVVQNLKSMSAAIRKGFSR